MTTRIHITSKVIQKGLVVAGIAFIVASGFVPSVCGQSVSQIARRVAAREAETAAEREHYTYRQTVRVEELDLHGAKKGEYLEVRDVIFLANGERSEKFLRKPEERLFRLRMTEEDYRDVREVQPFLFTTDQLWAYEVKLKGEETVEGVECYLLDVRPRQTFAGQRLFEGLVWAAKSDFFVIKSQGRAVPQILNRKSENLFPGFTTIRARVDGKFWFPVRTFGDDVLPFRSGPIRERLEIRYENYQRFRTDSNVKF
ncbi:MAG: hypothetical protein NTY38_29355 [Acidobacteria bacterium]|nr:hypothetical protein [Acidobacteriota bacterium]